MWPEALLPGRSRPAWLAFLFLLLMAASALAAPVMDGERDASYTLVASSPADNLPAGDAAVPRLKSLDATDLWAANDGEALYLYIDLPYLDLQSIEGEWGVAFHLGGANDAIQRTAASDPYNAPVDFRHAPGLNAVLKSNMRGFKADYDGNQGYAFLIPVNKARTDWAWQNGDFLGSAGWTPDAANGTIHGRGVTGGEVVYRAGSGIEARIPLALFASDPANTDVTPPKPGDAIQMQFYDNVRNRDTNPPRYPRGPSDSVPFEPGSRTNPARGTLTQWASYTLTNAEALGVIGVRLTETLEAGHAVVSFSEPVGPAAADARHYTLTDAATGRAIPVTGATILPGDGTLVRLDTALPFQTRVRVVVSGITAAGGATLSPARTAAVMNVGTGVRFCLTDPYGAYSTFTGCAEGAPCRITLTGDMIGWRTGADEIPVEAVAGQPVTYSTAPLILAPGVYAYKYRLPGAPDTAPWANWNALNPHDRFLYVPAVTTLVNVWDDATNNLEGTPHSGGPARVVFTLDDRGGVAAGRPVYLTGDMTGWSDAAETAIPMEPVPGRPNTYRAAFTMPNGLGWGATTRYKYIVRVGDGGTEWGALNPLGDRWVELWPDVPGGGQNVYDVLGGSVAARALRVGAGLETAPMWSNYFAALDLSRDGRVGLADAILAARASGPLPRLTAHGVGLVDPAGRPALLRGVNLGGWLVEEMWMTPWLTDPPAGTSFPKVEDHETLWGVLTQRFGAAGAQALKNAWRDAWITAEDFTRIKAAGFDHVRLPFLWDLFNEPGGMDRLRAAVTAANDAGLYVVLDMHGAPGGQNPWDHSGRVGRNAFFSDPGNVEKGVEIWTTLAREFGANPGVAAFDLLNEPAGAPDAATLYAVSNQLYQGIRAEAPNTIVIVEDGYKGFGTLPDPETYGWKNVMYSTHIYNFGATKPEDHAAALRAQMPALLQVRADRDVPVYIGEFSVEPHSTPEGLAAFLEVLNENGFQWAPWTWKTVARGGRMGFWGYYSNTGPVSLNPFVDSLSTLMTKMDQVRTANLSVPPGLAPVYLTATGR